MPADRAPKIQTAWIPFCGPEPIVFSQHSMTALQCWLSISDVRFSDWRVRRIARLYLTNLPLRKTFMSLTSMKRTFTKYAGVWNLSVWALVRAFASASCCSSVSAMTYSMSYSGIEKEVAMWKIVQSQTIGIHEMTSKPRRTDNPASFI